MSFIISRIIVAIIITRIRLENMNVHIVLVECNEGYYGDKCHIACGNCLHEKSCDRLNGTCYHGCKDHFKGMECTGKKVPLFFT